MKVPSRPPLSGNAKSARPNRAAVRLSFEEWTQVSRKLEEDVVIQFVHSSNSQIAKLIRAWLPASWKVKEETDELLDGQVFMIIGSYDLEPLEQEHFQRRFVELWTYDRFSNKLTCRRQVITAYPGVEGGLKEVPSPYVWKDKEEIHLTNADAGPDGFLLILNQDIFRSKEERKIRGTK